MAFSKGNVSTEAAGFKRYIGVGAFRVHGVNLSNEELSKLYGRDVTGDKNFVSTVDMNGISVPRARLVFTLSTEIDGKQQFFNAVYNVTNARRVGSTTGKTQVIDEYGRDAWATQEELDAHAIPQYASGPANVTDKYRPAYVGEEFLTAFMKAYLAIPNVVKFREGKPAGLIDNPAEALARFDHIADYFKGDFSEINNAIKEQPLNKVQLLCGVRKDDQNRLWQDFFIDFPMRASGTDYTKLRAALDERLNNGGYPSTEFLVGSKIVPLQEYVENPTTITPSAPAAAGATPASPWFQGPTA